VSDDAPWADVVIDNVVERRALEAKALFFLPTAARACRDVGLNVSTIMTSLLIQARSLNQTPGVGRSVVSKILNVLPVRYDSAVQFIAAVNPLLAEYQLNRFDTGDIVACVFRLKDPDEVFESLGLTSDGVARACGLRYDLVASALLRYRLQLNDALALWRYLTDQVAGLTAKPAAILRERLTDDPSDFIKTDARPPMAIKTTRDGSVYTLDNLKAAPASGHRWAVHPALAPGR
jgi:hypothetical protein